MSAQFYNQIGAFEMDDEYVQWSTSCKEIGVGFHFVNRWIMSFDESLQDICALSWNCITGNREKMSPLLAFKASRSILELTKKVVEGRCG